ncbi:MAG: hypothetical protein ACJ8KU_10475 [Chthoniobacterales bacterium]
MQVDYDTSLNWWCPNCLKEIVKPLAFFLAPRCACPHCGTTLNMSRLSQALDDLKPARTAESTEIRAAPPAR